MNLTKLFELQKVLDERVEQNHPRLDGEDRLAKKILALQVELGELANEWRGFKFWSTDQEPRRDVPYEPDNDDLCLWRHDPLLEEYVDCLHFILSIGLHRKFPEANQYEAATCDSPTRQFCFMFEKTGDFFGVPNQMNYFRMWELFLGLGQMLGFTWDEIEAAYISKNTENHARQDSGY